MKNNYLLLCLLLIGLGAHSQTADIFDVARKGTTDEATLLLKSDPKLANTTNPEGYTPLILATYRGNNAVAKLLLEKGANIDAISGMGTALMAAVVKGNDEMVKFLLDRKANPNLNDANGSTALLYAVMFKKHDIAKLLIKSGANTEQKDNRGQSAIDYAILANDDKLIEILKTKKL
ncbi:MAG: ankyrin repeat domain-containing protein [Flavobacterium sp.]|uniref:ankyrin repeat domain-containing protein n=1 Tax=Flavobacterium sp. TaxID=239 RepID=UPI00121F8A95|nr:ankyrin repeat domain-containing protein [Flavobacterium sp.]RZJ63356.1 MAG: ankyrin repeat domain-containing protein [Flavobacterium sp.]